jgi:hypothetical protein
VKQEMKMNTQESTLLTDEELSAVAGGGMYPCADGTKMLVANMDLGGGTIIVVSAGATWHHVEITHA